MQSKLTPPQRTKLKRKGQLTHPQLDLEAFDWVDSSEDNDGSRLLSKLQIGGCYFHVEAYETKYEPSGLQIFPGSFGDTVDKCYEAIGGDGAWSAVQINGRDYVLIITPYCE